jgi:hypothetical protein
MLTGINQIIIANSRYYRYDTYFLLLIVGAIIVANKVFIPIYGIAGSAMATALTMITYNTLRWIFLYFKFKMQPYDLNSLKIILISGLAFLPGLFIPYLGNLVIDIAVRSFIVGGAFVFLLLKMEAAPEINSKVRKILKQFKINL